MFYKPNKTYHIVLRSPKIWAWSVNPCQRKVGCQNYGGLPDTLKLHVSIRLIGYNKTVLRNIGGCLRLCLHIDFPLIAPRSSFIMWGEFNSKAFLSLNKSMFALPVARIFIMERASQSMICLLRVEFGQWINWLTEPNLTELRVCSNNGLHISLWTEPGTNRIVPNTALSALHC